MANIVVENITAFVRTFVEVAARDPLSAILVVTSVLIMTAAFGVFGYLTLGAIVSTIVPDSIGRTPPQQDR